MTRTFRNTKYASFFRHPQTLSQKKAEQKALEEISDRDRCTHNRLRRNKNSSSIPSAWDDLNVSGREEVYQKKNVQPIGVWINRLRNNS